MKNQPSAPAWFSAAAIGQHCQLPDLVLAMRRALAASGREQASAPLRSIICNENPFSAFGTMSALSPADNIFVAKVASFVRNMAARNLPAVHAIVVVMRADTGEPLAMLDGAAITNLKCAAVTALVTEACAVPEAEVLAVLGTGTQAREQVRGVMAVRAIRNIRVYSRQQANVRKFVAEMRVMHPDQVVWTLAGSAAEAIVGADIVSAATTSTAPILERSHLSDHVHINCMGAHTPASREVGHDVLERAHLVVEDVETAVAEAGDVHRRAISIDALCRRDNDSWQRQLTVFSSTGHAYYDLLTACYALMVLQ